MNKRLQALRAEHDHVRAAMDAIESEAVDASRDLTDEEVEKLGLLRARYDECATNIADVAEREEKVRATSDILAQFAGSEQQFRTGVAIVREQPRLMTPGEYAYHVIRAQHGTPSERDEAVELLRTVQETGTSDTTGILPTPIVGDLVKFVDANRYVVNSMRPLPMPPKGKTFTRPRLTQSTQSAAQTEKSQLNSRQLTTTGDTVTKATHGTVLNLTEQDIDWSEPSLLDIVYEDMAEEYAIDTEATAAAAITAAATATTPFDISTANLADTIQALALGAAATYGTAKKLPDVVFAAVNVWGFLAGLTDEDGRPAFPNLSPVNAPGTLELTSFQGNPMGLKLCVSPAFADNFLAVASSRYCEVYEQNKGFVTINAPSNLEVQVAYRGYFATNVYAKGLTSLQ